jgi:ubiquinone/menaquinone biosynthesis C-methylase UbiE
MLPASGEGQKNPNCCDDPYRSVAQWYDKLFRPTKEELRAIGLSLFPPEKGMSVLDVGCGTGLQLETYRRYQCALHGIDASPSLLAIAGRRLGDAADLRLGDAARMPFEDGSFDLVTATMVLHEMAPETRGRVMGEMKRVLKRDGRILLIDFHPGPLRPVRGWTTKLVIILSEFAAGREHFRNYRQFMRSKSLPQLIADHGLAIEGRGVAGGGALAAFLIG